MKHTTRRKFIGCATMAFPSLLWASEEPLSQGVQWKPKQALSSVMFSELSLEEFCATATRLGFKGIDLWGPFGKCRHLIEAQELGAEAFQKLLKQHDLQVGVWTTYRHKDNDQVFLDFAEFIGACGGGIVVRGSSYEGTAKHKLEGSIKKFYEDLQPQIEMARKQKVRLAIENHAHAILDSPESFKLFKRLNPAPDVVGFSVAPYHLQKRNADVAEVIRICGDQLLFFYAWQQAGGTKQLPGIGPVDFTPWLKTLKEQKYKHWMTPFMHGELPAEKMTAEVSKAFQYLNNLTID